MNPRQFRLSLLIAAVGVCGCGRPPAPPPQSVTEPRPPPPAAKPLPAAPLRLAVCPKGTAHVFWQTVRAGALAAGKDCGAEIAWNGPAKETEYNRQVEIIENYLAQKMDGFVIAPTEKNALVPVVEKVFAAGKPVIIFDSGIQTEKYHSFVATDNYQGGVLAARKLGELLGGKGNVAVVKCAPGGASTLLREDGFRDTIAKEFAGIKIVAEQFGMSDRAKSLEVAENMLTANKDLAALFGSNESSAVGAVNAVKNAGLAGKVKVVGFDSSDVLLAGLKEGSIAALVVQNPFKMGYEAVKAAVARAKGQDVPRRIDTGVLVVTPANLDQPDVQAVLNPKLE